MPEFDAVDYFNRQAQAQNLADIATPTQDKISALAKASQEKQDYLATKVAETKRRELHNAGSWVGKLGLDPNGIAGQATNLAASAYSGASRLVGDIVGFVGGDLEAIIQDAGLDEADIQAIGRHKQGKLQRDDFARITRKDPNNPNALSPLERFDRAVEARKRSASIDDAFDRTDVVHQDRRADLSAELGNDFQSAWDQTKAGFKAVKGGDLSGSVDLASGVAKLIFNAGEAAVTNPGAAAEYIAENVPQLATGVLGKAGKGTMLLSNVGYASEQYQKGIQKYQDENGGAYPPAEERQKMAAWAASLALAEEVGDVSLLKGITGAGAAAKTGFKEGVKNAAKEAGKGFASEALTEGYQTYGEGEASRTPATAQQIYEGAVVGGLAGGGLSGGGRALAEVAGATPEQAAAREDLQTREEAQKAAIATGDVTPLVDPKSKAYDPAKAIAALSATKAGNRAENLKRAGEILSSLESERAGVEQVRQQNTPEGLADLKAQHAVAKAAGEAKKVALLEQIISDVEKAPKSAAQALTKQVAQLDKLIEQSREALVRFNEDLNAGEVDVPAQVEAIKAADPVVSPKAAETLINLSMAIPERLDTAVVESLVSDEANGLTPDQRSYLRAFSEARVAENKLKDLGKVAQEIYAGGNGNVGIAQHRARIAAAVAAGNKAGADQQLAVLRKFEQDHRAKAAAVAQAWEQGRGNQVVKTKDGQWVVATQLRPHAEVRKNGGLTVNTVDLVAGIKTESEAISKALGEMNAAYALKFSNAPKEASNVTDVPKAHGKTASQATPAAEQEAPAVGSAESGDGGAVRAAGTASVEAPGVVPPAPEAQSTPSTAVDSVDSGVSDAVSTQSQSSSAEGSSQYTNPTSANAERGAAATQAEPETTSVTESADSKESAEQTTGKLSVFDKKSPEGASFQLHNLIADYFSQSAAKEGDSTQRPLASVKNFLSEGWNQLSDYLSSSELAEEQVQVLRVFKEKAGAWAETIQKNLARRKQEFWYTDMLQFFMQEAGDALDLEENVKTAMSYAAFSWVAENSTRSTFNDADAIRDILGLADHEEVTEEMVRELSTVGTRQNTVANALGQRAVQALGLKAVKGAPRDVAAKLESHLGAHIFKMLMDQDILVRTTVPAATMKRLTGSTDTREGADHYFLKLDPQAADEIYQASKGTKGVLDKLFGAEPGLKEPAREPIPFTQSTTRNTNQAVPESMKEIIERENAGASYVDGDMYDLVQHLDEDIVLEMAGAKHIDAEVAHKANRPGLEAKNDGLRRELQRIKDFVSGLVKEDDTLAMPLYFEHTVWKQQRVGIATNMVNPQTSKIHRHMLFRKSWETTVDRNDQEQLDNFHLRVAEGLGVKTDKQSNEKSLETYAKKIADPKIQAALKLLQKRLAGEDLSTDEQATLLDGVKAGGENFHSLHALMSLAHEANAIEAGKDTFKVRLMGEVDGVTNGPMLSHLLLGAAKSAQDLFGLLNRGGFFEQGNEHNQYNLWREAAGHFDLYETTTLHMTEAVQSMLDEKPELDLLLKSIYGFTGELTDKNGRVAKAGRNIIKTPLTAMVFGSSVGSAVESMANKFIESIYAGIEDTAKKSDGHQSREQLIENINVMLSGRASMISTKMSVAELMEYQFSEEQIKGLKKAFKDTIGKAVRTTMETDFADYIEQRTKLNQAAQLSFELYDAAYQALRAEKVAELVKSGEIAVNAKTGKPLHDLTQAQENEIRKRLAKMAPVVHTPMSKESGSLRAGLYMSKSGRKLSDKSEYAGEIKFGTPFKDNGAKSTTTHAYESTESNPGVAMVPMLTHSTDSAVMHRSIGDSEVLNVHDAKGVGVGGFQQAAQSLNQSVFNTLVDYSPAAELQSALSRTVQGLAALLQEEGIHPTVKANVTKVIEQAAANREVDPADLIGFAMQDIKDAAFKADDIKLQVMADLQAIDQYALEGGNYEVTDADRKAAAERRAALSSVMSEKEQAAIESIKQAFSGETLQKVEAKTSIEDDVKPTPKTWAQQAGQSRFPSDMQLMGFFADKPATTARETLRFLYGMLNGKTGRTNEFYVELIRKLAKTLPADLRVEMITPETSFATITPPTEPAFGWFTPRGDYRGVFLMGHQMKNSGLTPEVVVHELLHAALFDKIEANPELAEVKELEQLREKALAYVKQNQITGFDSALSNVHELVSWGMTNQAFQRQVLNQISMESKTGLVNGMKAFVQKLVGILFKGSSKTEQQQAESGITVLIGNVSALLDSNANQATVESNQTLAMSIPGPVEKLQTYSTIDIHEALNAGNVSPSFDAQLRNVLGGIVEKLHGPFGSFKAQLMKQQAMSPMDVWLKALDTGVAPFAASVQKSPFKASEQELHAMEQVEAVMRAALERNEVTAKTVYKELDKLYTEMRAKLKPADFGSQDEYNFLFKQEIGADGKSHHLARFAAFGLAHEQVNALLKVGTAVDTRRARDAGTFAERLQILFEQVLEFFHTTLTRTYGGQQADQKLNTLVSQLVDIEAKKRLTLARQATDFNPTAGLEAGIKNAGEKIRGKVAKVAGSKFIRNHKSPIVRAAGGLARNYANDQVDWFLKGISEMRDQAIKEKYGLAMGLLTDVRGPGKMLNALMLASTNSQRKRKQIISTTASVALEAFANGGKDLSPEAKAGISAVFLRTGLHALQDSVNMAELEQLLSDGNARDARIKDEEGQLSGFGRYKDYFIHQANALAYYKATGKVRTEKLMMNSYNIARLFGTAHVGKLTEVQSKQAEAIIEKLVALYSMEYTKPELRKAAVNVLRTENARTDGKGNGVEFVLALHKRLEQESKDRLFRGQKALVMHGYTPEIYNPHAEVVTADDQAGAELMLQGYQKVSDVSLDQADPDRAAKGLYVLKDGGLMPYLTGIISYTGKRAKGSTKHSGYTNVNTAEGLENASKNADILHAKSSPLPYGPRPDLSKVSQNYLAPVMNPHGEIVNWRYLMADSTKDSLLERDNRFEKVLGALAGSIYDKETTQELNGQVVHALHEQYMSERGTKDASYLLVGPRSSDPDLREIWGMLPDDTQQLIRSVWGRDGMYVRKDALTITFGYRKRSVAEAFEKTNPNEVEKLFMALMKEIFGEKAALRVRQGERAWQELVHEVKDILVVKTGTVMLGNIWSNLSLLVLSGVPMTDMLKHHLVALRGARAYQQDSEELASLKIKLETGLTQGQVDEINQQIARLEDAIARNPVKDLIDAGSMPTIVEDVAQDDDIYSYKSSLVRHTDRFTNKLNPNLVAAAKNVYMAHDTRLYQGLSRITQLSDFVARYTMYQHLTNRKVNPLSHEDAVFEASELFINYDIPMHKDMQYLDDMGLTMFTKYFLRIQRVLGRMTRDNPARVLTAVVTGNFLDLGPIVLDGSAVHKIGNNPFGLGALQLPATLDELATISGAMALLK